MNPNGLLLTGDKLYGIASIGFTNGFGTVFSVNTNGTSFSLLRVFDGSDGAEPTQLISSVNTLYGTTSGGGSSSNGTVFAVNTDGTSFTTLYSFSGGADGAFPGPPNWQESTTLLLSGSMLYGTAGGGNGSGTIFALDTNGSGFRTVYGFAPGGGNQYQYYTNRDGAFPHSLVLSGDTLYGTTGGGGTSGAGNIFSISIDGTGFRVLHSFATINGSGYNSDGYSPGNLILSGGSLYGRTFRGSSVGGGTLFTINTNGTGFRTLYTFTTGSSGNEPTGLILAGNLLYGTTWEGNLSTNIYGVVFAINTDGTGFKVLLDFSGGDGSPDGGLVWSGNALYGTTADHGGGDSAGVIFKLPLPVAVPRLSMSLAATNAILSWPASPVTFNLQSTSNLLPAPSWVPVSAPPVFVNGQNTVTNPISGPETFYRLSH
jgi:uncharacterized repeat protein (TIGR03803 family)